MDFQTSGEVLHAAREVLKERQDAGISDAEVERLAAGITKGVDDFLNTHRDTEFTLEQVLNAVDGRLRLTGTIDPDANDEKMEAIHEATDAATHCAVERLGS